MLMCSHNYVFPAFVILFSQFFEKHQTAFSLCSNSCCLCVYQWKYCSWCWFKFCGMLCSTDL